MTDQYEGWTIKHRFTASDLFTGDEADDLDREASMTRFANTLTALLEGEFPGAEVDVINELGAPYSVDGPMDDDYIELVKTEQITEELWISGEWYVFNDAGIVADEEVE